MSPRFKNFFEIVIAIMGGFSSSFIALVMVMYTRADSITGQLLAGDPSANKEYPTTLNTMQGAMDGSDAIMNAMGSFTWWTMVMIGAVAASFIILKLMRKYA